MSQPNEVIEILGQLRQLHLLVNRLGEDANDTWCEEGGGWETSSAEWVARVDAYLHRIQPELVELMQTGSKMVAKR